MYKHMKIRTVRVTFAFKGTGTVKKIKDILITDLDAAIKLLDTPEALRDAELRVKAILAGIENRRAVLCSIY